MHRQIEGLVLDHCTALCMILSEVTKYCSLAKESPWAEYLISLPKRWVGALLSASAFNHGRAPMLAWFPDPSCIGGERKGGEGKV